MTNSDSPDQIILQVRDLKKHFPVRSGFLQRITSWVKAVNGVDFDIHQGQTLGLVGESGCGKSTVARMIMRLLQPDEGQILFRGQDIGHLPENEMKPFRKQMQIVFQDPYGSLNPRMTVGQSIEEGLRISGMPRGKKRSDRLKRLLEMVGMAHESADRYPHEFSGGQRQRIGIARALSVEPDLVICDEPISALDVSIQAQVINLLKDLQDQLGLSYLFISHDLNVVGYLCNYVAVMFQGCIVELAQAEELYADPRHPYTQTLLAAIPDVDFDTKSMPPQLKESDQPTSPLPSGCAFRNQCMESDENCQTENMPMIKIGTDHFVRCWKTDPNIRPTNRTEKI